MSKKEFYEKYIMSDDEKMMRIIHENARKGRNKGNTKKRENVRKWGIYTAISAVSMLIGLLVGIWI